MGLPQVCSLDACLNRLHIYFSMVLVMDSAYFLCEQILRDIKSCMDVFAIVGICYTGKVISSFAWSVLKGLYVHLIPKLRTSKKLRSSYGDWAVVTGCTSGIGRSYAIELARQDFGVVLIGRNIHKLKQLAYFIDHEFHVPTLIIETDLSVGAPVYNHIETCLKDLNVGILVNSVGVISARPVYLTEMSQVDIWEHVNVNIAAVTLMTRIVLPKMMVKNKGAIINLSSFSTLCPVPLLTVYSATKAYVDYFSRTLSAELSGTNIVVQTLIPSYINTQMVSYSTILSSEANPLVPSPTVYVQHALPTLGFANYTTGYWLHDMQAWLCSFLPTSVWIFLILRLNQFFRKKAI